MSERRTYQPPSIESLDVKNEHLGRGVFFDAHETLKKNGELGEVVVKEFHLDYFFSAEAAIKLFSQQEEEQELFSQYFSEEMIPKSIFLIEQEFQSDFDAAKIDVDPIYSYGTLARIQIGRRLAGRYGKDEIHKDREKKLISKAMKQVGDWMRMETKHPKAFIIQERIQGISFDEFFSRHNWNVDPLFEKLKNSVKDLIDGLRRLHAEQPFAAFTWHSFSSDNVMIETDKNGKITGRVVVLDTNFLLRADEVYKRYVVQKLEKNILQPLEEHFAIN